MDQGKRLNPSPTLLPPHPKSLRSKNLPSTLFTAEIHRGRLGIPGALKSSNTADRGTITLRGGEERLGDAKSSISHSKEKRPLTTLPLQNTPMSETKTNKRR